MSSADLGSAATSKSILKPYDWYGCYKARRDGLFLRESNRHPAKMAVGLCFRIFEHGEKMCYWKKGDLILEPMAGIFTTGICGAALGYRVVGVELERHFVSLAQRNINFAAGKFVPDGACWILEGDARQLAQILQCNSDAAMSSPPYPSAFREEHPGTKGGQVALEPQRGGSFRGYSGAVSSPPYSDAMVPSAVISRVRKLARDGQIEEAIDACIAMDERELEKGTRWGPRTREQCRIRIEEAVEREEGGNYGARAPHAAIGSPPYGGRDDHGTDPHPERMEGAGNQFRGYGTATDAQIGNLRDPIGDIDAVLSSPPWEAQARGGQQGWSNPQEAARIAAERYQSGARRGHPARVKAIQAQIERDSERVYGNAQGQIGNERSETYLRAMFQVYQQLHLVLKPGGVVCLVTKNPVKKGQIRRLDLDTIRLMEHAGFRLIERFRAMLAEDTCHGDLFQGETVKRHERKSFFKRLFERDHPHLRVDHEDVLFFRRGNSDEIRP